MTYHREFLTLYGFGKYALPEACHGCDQHKRGFVTGFEQYCDYEGPVGTPNVCNKGVDRSAISVATKRERLVWDDRY